MNAIQATIGGTLLYCSGHCECEEALDNSLKQSDYDIQPVAITPVEYEEIVAEVLPYYVLGASAFNQFGRRPQQLTEIANYRPDVLFEYARCGAVSCVFMAGGEYFAAGFNANDTLIGCGDCNVITKLSGSFLNVVVNDVGDALYQFHNKSVLIKYIHQP